MFALYTDSLEGLPLFSRIIASFFNVPLSLLSKFYEIPIDFSSLACRGRWGALANALAPKVGLLCYLWFVPIVGRSIFDLFRQLPIFSAVGDTTLEELTQRASTKNVVKFGRLFTEGDAGEGLWLVQVGEIKIMRSSRDGREQIVYFARPGRLIVDGIGFSNQKYPASAEGLRESKVALVSNHDLEQIGMRDPQLLLALLDARNHRADRVLDLVSDLSLRTVPARLASFLCRLIDARIERGQDADTLVRDMTTENVAGRLGTVREEVSRALGLLEKSGAITLSADLIHIHKPQILHSISLGEKPE